MRAATRIAYLTALLAVGTQDTQRSLGQPVPGADASGHASTLAIGTQQPIAPAREPSGGALSDGPPAAASSFSPDELDRLLTDLGSNDYPTRLQATIALAGLNAEALDELASAYATCDDFEVRLRLARLVERGFVWQDLLSRHGFLGISLDPPMLSSDDGAPVAPGAGAIRVKSVLQGTAAEAAGVRKGDLMLALNGEPIPLSMEFRDFINRVSSLGADGLAQLEILRDGRRLIAIDVPLRHRPRENYWPNADWDQLVSTARRFEHYWQTHFAAPPDATSTSDSGEAQLISP